MPGCLPIASSMMRWGYRRWRAMVSPTHALAGHAFGRIVSAIGLRPPRRIRGRERCRARLRHDPAMRWIVGSIASHDHAASPSQMGRFETQWLAAAENLSALADLSGKWIDLVHGRRPPR